MKKKFEDIMCTINFYRFNPHSIPVIQQLLCKIGRHDYEAWSCDQESQSVHLQCFYCCHGKISRLIHR